MIPRAPLALGALLALGAALAFAGCGEAVVIGEDGLRPSPCLGKKCGEPCDLPCAPGPLPCVGGATCDLGGTCSIQQPLCPDPQCAGQPCGTPCSTCSPGDPKCPPPPPPSDAGTPGPDAGPQMAPLYCNDMAQCVFLPGPEGLPCPASGP